MFSRPKFFAAVAASMFGALVAFYPGTAHAIILSDCGGVDLDSGTTCSLAATADCSTQCTAPNFQLQCSADLEASCSGGCMGSIDANCSATCVSSCTGGCTSGNFSCEGSCDTDCNGHCSGHCQSDPGDGGGGATACEASCKETCDSSCSGSCSGTPPMCTPVTCQAECQGSCQAQANFNCQVNCQESGTVTCEANYTGGCNTDCSGGVALFCNGQYVHITNLQACEAQLTSLLNINVSASAACSSGSCTGQAAASCGQIAPGAMPMSEGFLAVGLGAGILGAVRRRIRKAKKA